MLAGGENGAVAQRLAAPGGIHIGAQQVAVAVIDEDLRGIQSDGDGQRPAAQEKRLPFLDHFDGGDGPFVRRFSDGIGKRFGDVGVAVRLETHVHQIGREEGDVERGVIGHCRRAALRWRDTAHGAGRGPLRRPGMRGFVQRIAVGLSDFASGARMPVLVPTRFGPGPAEAIDGSVGGGFAADEAEGVKQACGQSRHGFTSELGVIKVRMRVASSLI